MREAPIHKNKIVIVGNPNVGKSALFNKLAKEYSIVANYPYTTIEVIRGDIVLQGKIFELIDTPGIYSLEVQSEDEIITRDILIKEHPEYIIQCIDATALERSLVLTSELLELTIPLIICLTNVDGALQRGIKIDSKKLSRVMGVPVVETVAPESRGLGELLKAIGRAKANGSRLTHKGTVERALKKMMNYFPQENLPSPAVLLLLLLQDSNVEEWTRKQYGDSVYQDVKKFTHYMRTNIPSPLTNIIFKMRKGWAESVTTAVMDESKLVGGGFSETLGRLTRHPIYGWGILGIILYLTYILVGKIGAVFVIDYINVFLFVPFNRYIGNSIPWPFWRDFAVGEYGILTLGFTNAIGTVLPILTIFFIIVNTLEDVGYIPNLCILSNRLFQKVGLSGKSVLPIVLGFGCKTMATLTTKILDSKRERYIAVFLIAFAIPCSAQLGVNIAVLALFPFSAFILVFSVITALEIIAGIVLNKILREETYSDFILEIPPLRIPHLMNLVIKTYYRLKWFLVEAVPLFIAGALILFLMDKLLILNAVQRLLSPIVVSFLGLPEKCVEVFLLSIARREAGAVVLMNLVKTGQLDYVQICVSVIVMTSFIPCSAHIVVMARELGLKITLLMVLSIAIASIVTGGIVHCLLRSLW